MGLLLAADRSRGGYLAGYLRRAMAGLQEVDEVASYPMDLLGSYSKVREGRLELHVVSMPTSAC